jgi:very-short-patch-repair endonuclease
MKLSNPTHVDNCRKLRQQGITCERILWKKLRNRAFLDLKFRRQHSIGKYIADFYCEELKLIIEIDGATHSTEKEVGYDSERQKYLESLGLNVKRYTNTDVKERLGDLMYDLSELCLELRKNLNLKHPHPSPLPRGEGENAQ